MRCETLARGSLTVLLSAAIPLSQSRAAEPEPARVTLRIHVNEKAANTIPRNLTGKFCEHLGANIYNGMDAQILRNPTFADYPFWTGQMNPDGLTIFQSEKERIEGEVRRQAMRFGWPEAELGELLASRNDGLACFWSRAGGRDEVNFSPDTGPHGGRAQRLECKAGAGLKQWVWLPLHRIRAFEFELLARSPDVSAVKLSLSRRESEGPVATTTVAGFGAEWRKLTGSISLPADAPGDTPYCLTLSAESAGQIVLAHVFLRPADHINGADPDVVRLLKESRLPLLRWPGGNFVSSYHWGDGVGPIERRPTLPNFAWGAIEPNTFGTDEFMAFCEAVGCEPMICINGGTGTPEEAARWIEYCNGPTNSPMGARRAANGHAQPYHVKHWEVGNELWGHWQAHWTTAAGYADRYLRFVKAMKAADPGITLYACGAPVLWGKDWNDTLLRIAAGDLQTVTDHPLIGGDVPRVTEPLDVFRDFMLVPDVLERNWGDLRQDMSRVGIANPRLAVTELQLFAHLGQGGGTNGTERLTRENLVNPGTLAEALYDTLIYHSAVRLQPLVSLITHSATVNHGGGLRKEHERVYANPCHYAHQLLADFAEATPVRTDLECPVERAPIILPDIRKAGGDACFKAISALAALAPNGDLLISLVHRGTFGPFNVAIDASGFAKTGKVDCATLSGSVPWAVNTIDRPALIKPVFTQAEAPQARFTLVLAPFSVTQVRFPVGR